MMIATCFPFIFVNKYSQKTEYELLKIKYI